MPGIVQLFASWKIAEVKQLRIVAFDANNMIFAGRSRRGQE